MKKPNANGVKPQPQRAEPLQPDLPGKGSGRLQATSTKPSPQEAEDKSKEQSRTALQNVRDGYGD